MSIYDEIKSPLDDDENIKKLVDIYVNGRVNSGTELIESGDGFYKRIVDYGSEQNNNENEYFQNFYQYIKLPNLNKLYQNIRKMDIESYDEQVKNIIDNIKTQDISEDEKEEQIQKKSSKYMFPLSRFKNIINSFETYTDIDKEYMDKVNPEIVQLVANMGLYPSNKQKLKKLNLTDEQIDYIEILTTFRRIMNNRFKGESGVMGFHINPQEFQLYDTGRPREKDDIKFYINAGVDTFKFASLFQKKCEDMGINYYYKVVDPYENEQKRNDRMCIYSEFKDADKFLEIIKELRQQNPDIKFENPPILTGTIDEFIGVGTDHITEGGRSYNVQMSRICFDSISDVFEGIPREKIQETIKEHPEMIEELKKEIKSKAKDIGLAEDKICIREDMAEKLGKNNPGNQEKTENTKIGDEKMDNNNFEVDFSKIEDELIKKIKAYRDLPEEAEKNKIIEINDLKRKERSVKNAVTTYGEKMNLYKTSPFEDAGDLFNKAKEEYEKAQEELKTITNTRENKEIELKNIRDVIDNYEKSKEKAYDDAKNENKNKDEAIEQEINKIKESLDNIKKELDEKKGKEMKQIQDEEVKFKEGLKNNNNAKLETPEVKMAIKIFEQRKGDLNSKFDNEFNKKISSNNIKIEELKNRKENNHSELMKFIKIIRNIENEKLEDITTTNSEKNENTNEFQESQEQNNLYVDFDNSFSTSDWEVLTNIKNKEEKHNGRETNEGNDEKDKDKRDNKLDTIAENTRRRADEMFMDSDENDSTARKSDTVLNNIQEQIEREYGNIKNEDDKILVSINNNNILCYLTREQDKKLELPIRKYKKLLKEAKKEFDKDYSVDIEPYFLNYAKTYFLHVYNNLKHQIRVGEGLDEAFQKYVKYDMDGANDLGFRDRWQLRKVAKTAKKLNLTVENEEQLKFTFKNDILRGIKDLFKGNKKALPEQKDVARIEAPKEFDKQIPKGYQLNDLKRINSVFSLKDIDVSKAENMELYMKKKMCSELIKATSQAYENVENSPEKSAFMEKNLEEVYNLLMYNLKTQLTQYKSIDMNNLVQIGNNSNNKNIKIGETLKKLFENIDNQKLVLNFVKNIIPKDKVTADLGNIAYYNAFMESLKDKSNKEQVQNNTKSNRQRSETAEQSKSR